MTHELQNQTGLFASSALGAFWWIGDLLYRHGPSWSILPPTLIGIASVVGAARGYANDRQARQQRAANDEQERRHKEERHKADMVRRLSEPAVSEPGAAEVLKP
jgi:hypothetical protein